MNTQAFYSRFPWWIIWLGIVGAAVDVVLEFWLFVKHGASLGQVGRLHLFSAACMLLAFAFFVTARRHRLHSPTVEISDDEIIYGLSTRFFLPRRRVAMDEVVEILPSKPSRVELRMRSGKRVKVPLLEVARSERAAVREAIERRLARRGASRSDARPKESA